MVTLIWAILLIIGSYIFHITGSTYFFLVNVVLFILVFYSFTKDIRRYMRWRKAYKRAKESLKSKK